MKNTERNWKQFAISSLFCVKRPAARNKDDYENGDICFVASGAENNGTIKYCKVLNNEKLDEGNCITVSPVDGSCFYQPIDFLGRGGAGSSILLLYPITFNLNKYTGLFFARTIYQVTSSKYNYGRMANAKGLLNDKIQIPVDSSGKPDFEFMEDYMKEKEAAILKQYAEYQRNRLRGGK